ncbi:MAG: hypothetical protein A2Y60_04480 [Chloroflexi bacterium RBG_13_54_9]|nr:MAG: hypothetical protein A2Y60_04480 [Chloroflexi bacterium RBG_13_54_9]
MRRLLSAVVVCALAVALVIQAGCTPGQTVSTANITTQPTGISVSGEGKVTVTPDLAIVRLGVEAKASTVIKARDDAAKAMDAIMSALTGKGVDKKDIQTQRFTIYPYSQRTIQGIEEKGFQVSNMVTAKIRKIDNVADIIDAAILAGGDLTRMDSLTFTVDDPTPFEAQARDEAMADAKAKAERLASLANVKLGKPIYISEGGGFIPIPYSLEAAALGKGASDVSTPISPGELEVQLNVQVTYAIE